IFYGLAALRSPLTPTNGTLTPALSHATADGRGERGREDGGVQAPALQKRGDGGGYGLLREGYGDPYSPFERLVTGTDLGVTEDNSDHLKPYILEYLIEGAQYVYEETKDPVARETMVSLSDFMLGAMQDGGFWNYAQRHAAEGNSIGHMTVEIANGLLKSYSLTGDKRYKDAAFTAYHCILKAFDTYGSTLDGVVPPPDRHYFYPGDHCDLDFYRGSVGIDSIGRDPTGYLFTAMDRMLRIDPQADEFLLSAPTHPRQKWLIEQAPLGGLEVVHEIGHNSIAKIDLGRDGDQETGGKSELVLLEDGKPLGPAHSLHQLIRDEGKGRYSHWGRTGLYFSSSDNSDPLTNGRQYTYYFGSPEQIPPRDKQQIVPTVNKAFGNRQPHPSVAVYERGLQAERDKRYEDAIAVWEEVLKQWPDSAPELYRQIGLWEAAGKPEQMVATSRRFLKTFPNHDRAPEVRMKLVTWLLAQGQGDEARALLEGLAKSASGTPWGGEAQARLWRECGVGAAPATIIRATKGNTPQPQALTALRAVDGLVSEVTPQLGAAYDEANLYLKLV
ncbi:MAG: tetratricopeptide repeat protein, partial [Armatimonadota bacterium]